MKEMKTLTIRGTTYEIVDDKARRDAANAAAVNKRDCVAPIVHVIEGSGIAVADSSDRPIRNLRLFGKTTQVTTTGAQLLDFSAMKMDSGGTTVANIVDDGRTVTITGTKAYAMGYIDVDVTKYVGQMLYLSGTKSGGNTPSLTARLIKTDGTKTYIPAITSGYTVLSDDETISIQFIANNTATALSAATTATFTEIMVSPVQNAPWEPYSGGVAAPSPDYPMELNHVENPTVTVKGGNLLPTTYADGTSKTMNGVTFEVLSDGSVIVNGTATENAYFTFKYASNKMSLPNGWLSTYCGTGYGTGRVQIQNDIYVDGVYVHSLQTINEASSRKQFFGKVELGSTRLKVDAGVTVVSQRVYPMLCAFENPIDYEQPKQSQTLVITRNIPGIPVASDGNYMDENGQQWICDEIDFERGVYIQRIGLETANVVFDNEDSSGRFVAPSAFEHYYKNGVYPCICNIAKWRSLCASDLSCCVGEQNLYYKNDSKTLEEINAILADIPITVAGILATPIETALTEEELAAFNTLYTHKTNTTVLNNAGAQMEMEYSVDLETWAKKYIAQTSDKVEDEQVETAVAAYLKENPVSSNTSATVVNGVLVIE